MLIYHPAYDLNHAVFRLLRVLEVNPDHSLQWDTFRIVDIFYLFPHLISKIRPTRSLTKYRHMFDDQKSKFNRAPDPKVFIREMASIHEAVAVSLVSKGFLEEKDFKARVLSRTAKPLPQTLLEAFDESFEDRVLVEILAVTLASIPLMGENGLKARTGLLEFQYDPA